VNEITQAFVLAAGLGIRLRPLTDDLPKPLIPIFQKPLVTFALDHLIDVGVNRFVINTHRHPDLFQSFFAEREYAGFPTTLVHEPDLLETGGGIKNAESNFGAEPFLTYSGDILTDVDLQPLIDEHFRRGNDVTLALRHTGLAAAVALRDQRVVDISNRYGFPGNFDFANIAVWNQSIFQRDLEFFDPSSNTGQRTVRVNDMRRITLGALVFPKHFGGITPYAGAGYTITVLGDARVFVDSVNTFPSNAFLDEVERERSRSAIVGIGGIQIQASKMAIFAQETLVPSNPSFLFNSVLNFFEFGIRLNFGSSIDRD
jgi:hypothetical protein